ncbi:MAG: COP23 domain-containing protein [Scytonema sp. PMC 1069.18]|nr:COP23 domain-containing protein [Scytonema sp. PMC 1069.18]MEC4883209.1 COP23 domain-containing protein [Scytonema sp. PMC 1070.18]
MLSQPLKYLLLSGLGLSMFLGNASAFAQVRSNGGDVVVPTEPATGTSRSSTTTTTTTGTGTSRSTSTTSTSTTIDKGTRFSCQMYNGEYTVMYQPESEPGRYFPWATPRTLGGGWDAQQRCVAIANRLESYRPDGLLELRTSKENGYDTLCATTEVNPGCRIVLTVPPEKDPYVVRNSVFQNLVAADSGEQTIGVNTYTSRGNNDLYNLGRTLLGGNKKPAASSKAPINLKPFLDRADGGTGRGLRNGTALNPQPSKSQSGYRLNPNKFR